MPVRTSRMAVGKSMIPTTFGSNSRTFIPGIKEVSYSFQGFFDADGTEGVDDVYNAGFGSTAAEVTTIVLPDGTTDSATYSFQAIHSSYSPWGGAIGDMAAFQIDGSGVGDSFKGKLLEAGQTARSSSSNSSGEQLVGITANETARATLHVIATTGSPTLDVTIQSDTSGFSTPTDRITFTQATAIGAQFMTSSAVHSDDYWRTEWTFGGTGDITFAVTFGIA